MKRLGIAILCVFINGCANQDFIVPDWEPEYLLLKVIKKPPPPGRYDGTSYKWQPRATARNRVCNKKTSTCTCTITGLLPIGWRDFDGLNAWGHDVIGHCYLGDDHNKKK